MIDIAVTQPFPWEQLLIYLSSRCIPNFEHVENGSYYRAHNGKSIVVRYDPKRSLLNIEHAPDTHLKVEVVDRAKRLFFPELPTKAIYKQLAQTLPQSQEVKGFRPLGCWDPFELCIRTIIGQQVSVAAAQTIMQRMVDRCEILTPSAVITANLDNMGMPGRRVQTLQKLAQAIIDGNINFAWQWSQLDSALADIPGIGPWTRGYLAIRLGRDSDAFPETDVGLIRASGATDAKSLLRQAEQWKPYRAYAATCLWAME